MFKFLKNLVWNPEEHTNEENLRWSLLRGIEWGIWPAFLSIPVVPISLIFFSWWKNWSAKSEPEKSAERKVPWPEHILKPKKTKRRE